MAGSKKAEPATGNGDNPPISLIKKAEMEMLHNIYVNRETGKVDPRYNRAFVIDKWRRSTLGTLPTLTLEEWNAITTEIFNLQLEIDRDRKALAAQAVLDRAANDPELLEALERRLAEIKAAQESRQSDRGRSARSMTVAS